ncbi:MAG: inositol monophosphatase [Thermoflavifilum sp.]|nr:inositol monophosphatase [Thermoflavifilum sp.]MCL6513659.1 inositol monophosphatase [Alicyclobacillus sp.]
MTEAELRKILAVAAEAAAAAGSYIRARVDEEKQVKTKSSPSDLVTDVDPACEALIRDRVRQSFPDHAWLGEESTGIGQAASMEAAERGAQADHLWVVDPLDGTTNFVCGMPLSTVSVAYAERGQVMAGVIVDPYRGEVFLGARGLGAWRCDLDTALAFSRHPSDPLPGVRMTVSTAARVEDSVVATGFPSRLPARDQSTAAGMRIAGRAKNLRALGSAALHMAYVACGRLDAFWEYDLNAWDLAAGALLVEEAGGVVEDLGGGAYRLQVRDVLAAGQRGLAEHIRELLRVP